MMRVFQLAGCVICVSAALVLLNTTSRADEEGSKPKHTIKDVMKAHKGKDSLLNKIKSGKATDKEKQQLLDLYISLYENEPPKGDVGSWRRHSGPALLAVTKVVVGRDGAVEELTAATKCATCHKAHKPD